MDGTALECVTVLFIAQFHAATHPEFAPLGLGAQLLVVFLALAVSIGAAGIPHAGLVHDGHHLECSEPATRIHCTGLGCRPRPRYVPNCNEYLV